MKGNSTKKNRIAQSSISKTTRIYSVYKKYGPKKKQVRKKDKSIEINPLMFPKQIVKFKHEPASTEPIEISNNQKEYIETIKNIFKNLDIFSKGVISQANINGWIPQAAFYFLGVVFQKIRQQRLIINQIQFIQECQKVKNISNIEDVNEFISTMKIFPKQKYLAESVKFNGKIDNSLKQRLEQTQKKQNKKFVYDEQRVRDKQNNNEAMTLPLRIIERDNSRLRKLIQIKPKLEQIKPFNPYERNKQLKYSPIKCKQQNQFGINLIQQSPQFHRNNNKQINKANRQAENDRIDKLAQRLQDYIRKNAARIQQTRNILQQF